MNQDIISFDVGTNFDYRIFDIIKKYDKKHSITNLYGKLRRDGLPGGRTAAIVPDFSMDQFKDYLKECQKNNLTFNYLINPLSLDQNMLDPTVGKQIREFIHTLYDIGVRAVTLNSPALIHYVKKNFPDMFVTLGLYAYPTKIQQIEYWRNWGVDEITLDHCFNRRFDLLRQLLTQYKDTDLYLRVIANNLCLRECPFRLAHGCFTGHSDPDRSSIDYSLINCNYYKVTQPSRILSSEWIRPDDLHYYRELAEETGNRHFAVKLVDRTRTTDFIERVIRAYMEESYEGNLLDILNWPSTKNMAQQKMIQKITEDSEAAPARPAGGPPPGRPALRFAEQMYPDVPPRFGRTMTFPELYIDNRKLDGFIEHFVHDYRCDETLCHGGMTEGEADNFRNACGYCEAWAKKAVTYDEQEVAQWKEIASGLLKSIEDGTLYRQQGESHA